VTRARLTAAYNADRARLDSQVRRYQESLDRLALSTDFIAVGASQVVNAATVPAGPFSPDLVRNLATAAVLALVLGLGLVFLLHRLDESVRTRDDFDSVVSPLPTLAVVPRLADWGRTSDTHVVTVEQPRSAAAEAYRSLRTALGFLSLEQPMKVIQITSPRQQDGKTTTTANLAVVWALGDQRVLVVVLPSC